VKDFIFIHITKNAGEAIIKTLRSYGCNMSFHPDSLDTLRTIIERIGIHDFKSYFSFAIVRNPWDRQVSLYNYIKRDNKHHLHNRIKQMTFEEYVIFLTQEKTCATRLQIDFISLDRKNVLVDFVGRFENLLGDFITICQQIGVDLELPKIDRLPNKSYRDYYNEKTAWMIEQIFVKDIEIFDYHF